MPQFSLHPAYDITICIRSPEMAMMLVHRISVTIFGFQQRYSDFSPTARPFLFFFLFFFFFFVLIRKVFFAEDEDVPSSRSRTTDQRGRKSSQAILAKGNIKIHFIPTKVSIVVLLFWTKEKSNRRGLLSESPARPEYSKTKSRLGPSQARLKQVRTCVLSKTRASGDDPVITSKVGRDTALVF